MGNGTLYFYDITAYMECIKECLHHGIYFEGTQYRKEKEMAGFLYSVEITGVKRV